MGRCEPQLFFNSWYILKHQMFALWKLMDWLETDDMPLRHSTEGLKRPQKNSEMKILILLYNQNKANGLTIRLKNTKTCLWWRKKKHTLLVVWVYVSKYCNLTFFMITSQLNANFFVFIFALNKNELVFWAFFSQ